MLLHGADAGPDNTQPIISPSSPRWAVTHDTVTGTLLQPGAAGPALDIQHSPVKVYLSHAGQPGQAGSDHPAEKQPKSLLKTQENRKANLLPEIGNFREQGELSKSANVDRR